ncbi:MAG TPA: VOC family protein [Candidatus Baltobacteraceae bacterium]|jgi:PhnB protein|nr:VOC family protein [Candidatus Baltobacteraceae bacterium]
MHIEAYIFFNGNCEEAFTFYQAALGGELNLSRYEGSPMESQTPADAKHKIMHASLGTSGAALMGADAVGDWKRTIGNNVALSLVMDGEDAAKRAFAKLAEGGKVTMELAPTFWGAKLFGMLTDKFGVDWMVSVHE